MEQKQITTVYTEEKPQMVRRTVYRESRNCNKWSIIGFVVFIIGLIILLVGVGTPRWSYYKIGDHTVGNLSGTQFGLFQVCRCSEDDEMLCPCESLLESMLDVAKQRPVLQDITFLKTTRLFCLGAIVGSGIFLLVSVFLCCRLTGNCIGIVNKSLAGLLLLSGACLVMAIALYGAFFQFKYGPSVVIGFSYILVVVAAIYYMAAGGIFLQAVRKTTVITEVIEPV